MRETVEVTRDADRHLRESQHLRQEPGSRNTAAIAPGVRGDTRMDIMCRREVALRAFERQKIVRRAAVARNKKATKEERHHCRVSYLR
jgi:hypothetical protein